MAELNCHGPYGQGNFRFWLVMGISVTSTRFERSKGETQALIHLSLSHYYIKVYSLNHKSSIMSSSLSHRQRFKLNMFILFNKLP